MENKKICIYLKISIVDYQIENQHNKQHTSSATLEKARYSPIQTGVVKRTGRHPRKNDD